MYKKYFVQKKSRRKQKKKISFRLLQAAKWNDSSCFHKQDGKLFKSNDNGQNKNDFFFPTIRRIFIFVDRNIRIHTVNQHTFFFFKSLWWKITKKMHTEANKNRKKSTKENANNFLFDIQEVKFFSRLSYLLLAAKLRCSSGS